MSARKFLFPAMMVNKYMSARVFTNDRGCFKGLFKLLWVIESAAYKDDC